MNKSLFLVLRRKMLGIRNNWVSKCCRQGEASGGFTSETSGTFLTQDWLFCRETRVSPQNQLRNPYSTERRRWDLTAVKSRLTGIKQVALCLAHAQQAASGSFKADVSVKVKCVIYTLKNCTLHFKT